MTWIFGALYAFSAFAQDSGPVKDSWKQDEERWSPSPHEKGPLPGSWEEREPVFLAPVFCSRVFALLSYEGKTRGWPCFKYHGLCLLSKFSQVFLTRCSFTCYVSLGPFPEVLNGCIFKNMFHCFTGNQVSGAPHTVRAAAGLCLRYYSSETTSCYLEEQVPLPVSPSKCLCYSWLFVLPYKLIFKKRFYLF